MVIPYILGGSVAVLFLFILFLGVCNLLVSPHVIPEEAANGEKAEMIGATVRQLIETNLEKRHV